MIKLKKLHNVGIRIIGIVMMFLGLTGARALHVDTPTDAPFRIKKVYEPKGRTPASFKQEPIPKVSPVPAPEKSQFPWLFRFSRKSTR